MRRFAWILVSIALGLGGCTAVLDTESLQGGRLSSSNVADASSDTSADVVSQCRSDAGPQASCIVKNCCAYIVACDQDPVCQAALGGYSECTATAKADSVKRAACAAAFRNAADGKANEVLNCENLYRDVCNDV